MSIPYRTQQNLKRLAIALLVLLVVGAFVWAMWILWLQRFVVYTREGAVLNFEVSETLPVGEEAVPPSEGMQIEIYYNEGEDKVNISTELAQLKGYYVVGSAVSEDPAGVWEQIQALPASTPVMLDMKSIYGNFYYTTSTGRPLSDSADIAGVDELIANLRASGYYTIARVPALRDKEYGRENTRSGIYHSSGGYLWMDDDGCYWLNPAKEDTITYLISIASELRDLGFNEVVFDDFCFPQSKSISFKGVKAQTLADTAQALVTNCATDYFAVSFVSDGSWTAPTGRSRIYRKDVNDPLQLAEATLNLTLTDPSIRLVFITSNMDTRFESYGVMRPINLAH